MKHLAGFLLLFSVACSVQGAGGLDFTDQLARTIEARGMYPQTHTATDATMLEYGSDPILFRLPVQVRVQTNGDGAYTTFCFSQDRTPIIDAYGTFADDPDGVYGATPDLKGNCIGLIPHDAWDYLVATKKTFTNDPDNSGLLRAGSRRYTCTGSNLPCEPASEDTDCDGGALCDTSRPSNYTYGFLITPAVVASSVALVTIAE